MTKARNYQREYELYHGRPDKIKERAQRVMARRKLAEQGKVSKGDGMDVDHARPLSKGGTSAAGNLRVVPKSENRSFARTATSKLKSQTSKRERSR